MLQTYLKKLAIATLSPSMRSPSSGITGWFARRLMRTANPESTRYAIQHRLELSASGVFVELGAGEGAGIAAVCSSGNSTTSIPSTIHLVEISEPMRKELTRVVLEDLPQTHGASIEIHGEDCKQMPYLADDSVDTIFGMNVVYFLDPLPEYVEEIHRVLKPGGCIVWGCKFDKVPKNSEIFVNVEEEKIKSVMKEAGFRVTSAMIDVGGDDSEEAAKTKESGADNKEPGAGDFRNYIEVKGVKGE